MATGRPTLYSDEMVEKALNYIENYREVGDQIPSAVGMALELGVAKSTLYKWAESDDTGFSDILAKCKDSQHRKLMNGGLSGDLNSNIVKLALGKHGYSDKQDLTHAGNVGVTDMTDDQLDAKLQALINASTE